MIYLTNFTNHTNYNLLKDNLNKPNISVCLEEKDVHYNPYDPYNGHEYIEIGGLKWATMNVGANSITDTGLYFSWGDIQGYTEAQVGSGEGQKYFGWEDYKYNSDGTSPSDADMTKYNSTDAKTALDVSDDAAQVNWGGQWRMPTRDEYVALKNAVNAVWTADYQSSGVSGLVCTAKTDSSKVLFFPACGNCGNGMGRYVGSYGRYWASSLYTDSVQFAYYLNFYSGVVNWESMLLYRCYGFTVRGVVD